MLTCAQAGTHNRKVRWTRDQAHGPTTTATSVLQLWGPAEPCQPASEEPSTGPSLDSLVLLPLCDREVTACGLATYPAGRHLALLTQDREEQCPGACVSGSGISLSGAPLHLSGLLVPVLGDQPAPAPPFHNTLAIADRCWLFRAPGRCVCVCWDLRSKAGGRLVLLSRDSLPSASSSEPCHPNLPLHPPTSCSTPTRPTLLSSRTSDLRCISPLVTPVRVEFTGHLLQNFAKENLSIF